MTARVSPHPGHGKENSICAGQMLSGPSGWLGSSTKLNPSTATAMPPKYRLDTSLAGRSLGALGVEFVCNGAPGLQQAVEREQEEQNIENHVVAHLLCLNTMLIDEAIDLGDDLGQLKTAEDGDEDGPALGGGASSGLVHSVAELEEGDQRPDAAAAAEEGPKGGEGVEFLVCHGGSLWLEIVLKQPASVWAGRSLVQPISDYKHLFFWLKLGNGLSSFERYPCEVG